MRKLLLALLSLTLAAPAQFLKPIDLPPNDQPLDPGLGIVTLRLYPGPAPNAHGATPEDTPTLTLFRPGHPNGTAVIVIPGGAYLHLASSYEGREPADFLANLGVTVFVLKHRLSPAYMYPIPLDDARRAIRLVRSLAPKLGYSPDRIGMLGFSAGGHLTATAATLPEPGHPGDPDPVEHEASTINFMVLLYPWLNAMQPQVEGPNGLMINYCSVTRVLTPAQCKDLETRYTPAKLITSTTPPAFIFHTTDDRTVPVSASIDFYTAMQTAGRDVELHIFSQGAHGSGMGGTDPTINTWPHLLELWLRAHNLLTPPPSAVR